jgi:hypothetical protein
MDGEKHEGKRRFRRPKQRRLQDNIKTYLKGIERERHEL